MTDLPTLKARIDAAEAGSRERCHAGKDGDCYWIECPQEKDGRVHYQNVCPLIVESDDEV